MLLRIIKFVIGLGLLSGLIIFFASGYTPPGICGEVIRHNQQLDLDASPLFYGDVENIWELVEGAERLRIKSGTQSKELAPVYWGDSKWKQ